MQTEPRTTTIDHAQQTAARIAGFLYLFLMVIAIYAFSVSSSFIAAGDAAKTAGNIMASERLFRLTIAIDLITAAGDVALAVALYTLLEPVNRSLALLGAFWRLAEAAIFAVIALMSIVVVLLLSGPRYLQAFSPDQLHALARLCLSAHGRGFSIGFIFLALGATVFSYLLLKSRYVPRALSAWGIFSYVVMLIGTFAIIIFPDLANTLDPVYYIPAFIFEVTAGIWLLSKGVSAANWDWFTTMGEAAKSSAPH